MAGPARVAFRGISRPFRLLLAAAGALAAAAVLAAAVATSPPPVSGDLEGHLLVASEAIALPGLPAATAAVAARQAAQQHFARHAARQHAARHGATPAGPAAKGSAARVPSGSRAPGQSPRGQAAASRASPTPSATPSRQSAQDRPIEIYDSVTPSAIPAGVLAATYATGHFAVPGSQMANRPTLWIDAWGTDPGGASVLDVEPGDATPAGAAAWVAQRLSIDHEPNAKARIYTPLAEWPAVRAAIATLPAWMQSHVRWWIADPTGVPHMVPGASATQWYWGQNYDISTANPGF